jgi:hypothetical protein
MGNRFEGKYVITNVLILGEGSANGTVSGSYEIVSKDTGRTSRRSAHLDSVTIEALRAAAASAHMQAENQAQKDSMPWTRPPKGRHRGGHWSANDAAGGAFDGFDPNG